MSTANKLIEIVQTIRNKAKSGFTPDELVHVKDTTNKLLLSKDALMAVISIGRVCPEGVNLEALSHACIRHNPLLLDELMTYPGVDAQALQENIIKNLSVAQGVARIGMWYPSQNAMPSSIQQRMAARIYSSVIGEVTDGPVHKRELSLETGALLDQAIGWVGTKITDDAAVFPLLRASHYILRGMARTMELHHQLDEHFVERVFNATWEHYKKEPTPSGLVNAIALTISNRDLFPEALSFLALHQPEAFKMVQPVWNEDGKEITKFLNGLKKDSKIENLVSARGASAQELEF